MARNRNPKAKRNTDRSLSNRSPSGFAGRLLLLLSHGIGKAAASLFRGHFGRFGGSEPATALWAQLIHFYLFLSLSVAVMNFNLNEYFCSGLRFDVFVDCNALQWFGKSAKVW